MCLICEIETDNNVTNCDKCGVVLCCSCVMILAPESIYDDFRHGNSKVIEMITHQHKMNCVSVDLEEEDSENGGELYCEDCRDVNNFRKRKI